MPAKERKALFNTFCANAVEEHKAVEAEAQARGAEALRALFTELLAVTPLQFRLFREGRTAAEVELEVQAEAALRTAALVGARDWEGEEDGEEIEGASAAEAAGDGDGKSFVAAIQTADLEMRPGGLFTASTQLADLAALLADDERWSGCPEETRGAVFAEVIGPVIAERAAEEAALQQRFRDRFHGWLRRQALPADAQWATVAAARRGRLAVLPDRIAMLLFDEFMADMRLQSVCSPPSPPSPPLPPWNHFVEFELLEPREREGESSCTCAEAEGEGRGGGGSARRRPEAAARRSAERRGAAAAGRQAGCCRRVPHAPCRSRERPVQVLALRTGTAPLRVWGSRSSSTGMLQAADLEGALASPNLQRLSLTRFSGLSSQT